MDEINFILAYVPEAEYYSFQDALKLAQERDLQASQDLERSILDASLVV